MSIPGALRVYADGVSKLASQSKTDGGWLRGLTLSLRDTADRIEALEAENARLREALKPFANKATAYDPPENDDEDWLWASGGGHDDLTIGDLRRARSALSEEGKAK